MLAAGIGLLTGLVLSVGTIALASPNGKGHHKGHRWSPEKMEQHLTEMTDRLNLSESQAVQIRAIFDVARDKGQAIKEQPKSREKMEAFRDLRFSTEDQLYAVLSCEQREGLRKLKREHKAQKMEKRWQQRQANPDKQPR